MPTIAAANRRVDEGCTRAAIERLGWDGEVIADCTLLGRRMDVLLHVDREALTQRREAGLPIPCLDAETLQLWSATARSPYPAAGVAIQGILLRRRRLTLEAVSAAAPWSRAFPTVVVVTDDASGPSDRLAMELNFYGTGLVRTSADDCHVIIEPCPMEAASPQNAVMARWLAEAAAGQWRGWNS